MVFIIIKIKGIRKLKLNFDFNKLNFNLINY